MALSFTSHLRYRMEWLGKHFILRSKNLEYGTCRNEKKKSHLSSFKAEIKKWIPENCPCRICKKYLPGLGFI